MNFDRAGELLCWLVTPEMRVMLYETVLKQRDEWIDFPGGGSRDFTAAG